MGTPTRNAIPAAVAKTGGVVEPGAASADGVILRGVAVALDTEVGQQFIVDCARNLEGQISDQEIKNKYELSDADWERLADNAPLLHAIRAEHDRRTLSGEAAREAAQRHLAKAPAILNGILTDEHVSPRHRIEAARELRQAASDGPGVDAGPREKVIIHIDLGGDQPLIFEKERVVNDPACSDDDGEPS